MVILAFLIAHFKPTVEQRMCQMIENVKFYIIFLKIFLGY